MIVNKYINGGGGGSGERGPQGYQGPEGPQGPQGANGQDGLDGKDGADGQTGPQGVEGAQGPQGPAGGGASGDTTILKVSQGFPMGIEAGDVATDGWPYIMEEKEGSLYSVSDIEADEWLTPSLNEGSVNFLFYGKPMEETTLLITKVSEIGDNVFMCVRFFIDEDGLHYEEATYHFENGTEWNPKPQSGDINTYDIPIGVTGYEIYPYSDAISGSIDWDGVTFTLNFMGWCKDTMAFSCPDDAAYLGTIYLAEEGVFVTTIEDQLPSNGYGYGVRAVTDGEGNFIGFYQFDDNSGEWKKIESGDNTILKAVSGAPATIENGDVYALHTPSADTQYEVSAWTETGEYTINFDHPVQAIKVHIKQDGHFDFGFNNSDWHDGFGFDIDADGQYGYVFSIDSYDSSRWEVSEQTVKFIAPEWMAKTDGKTLYLDIREDNGGYYLYIYTDDVEVIWITDVSQNETDGEIQEGTVIPAHGDIDKVFQANVKSEPNVKIELEGNARVDGTLDDPEQVVTMNDGTMKISFYDATNWVGNVCDLESYGTYFHLYYDYSTDGWTLFDSDEETALIKITDGESGDADFGDGNAYLSYSDGVLTAYTDNEKGWKNWDMGDTHDVVISNELAKVTDLPTKKQLIPDFNAQGGDGEKVLVTDYWNPDTAVWQERSNFVNVALRDIDNYSERPDGTVLTKLDDWNFGWRPIDQTILEPKSSLPVESEDGAVYALSSSGYGIYQAQSSHTGYNWFNLEGKTIPQGVITKFRVPYTDDGESNFVHTKTDPNGSGEMNLYWHPENPDNKYWDIGDPNGMNQYSAEFSLTDYWGNSLVAVKVGNYIEVTFGAPIYQGDDTISTYRNTEVYTEGSITDYKSVVMSNSINNIVKLTQAQYDALVSGGTVDENTFYIIVANPQS